MKARFTLAVDKIVPFKSLYEAQKSNRLPAAGVLEDLAKENGVPEGEARACVEMFIVNAKFLGILKPVAGAERVLALEQVLEEISTAPTPAAPEAGIALTQLRAAVATPAVVEVQDWENTCFYISPIGDEDSEHRAHADLFLGSIVEPALEEFGLHVVRADKIGKAGMITAQIIQYVLKSKLVIADLSYHRRSAADPAPRGTKVSI